MLEKMQQKIKMEISYLEPFVEAIPQYFISLGVYVILSGRNWDKHSEGTPIISLFFNSTWSQNDGNPNPIKEVFGNTTLGISNQIVFPLSLLISMLT